ncbi:aminoglycoside 6-adenylyltransferase [Haloplasma contractile]|uniref:Aminoglycoside 6-adenylyltransferase protein n=1 Tax=Haloplasma contractile SSD-17B TaxID=1033810 RepID=F7Q0R5_9MOLU|nr:aminoglycoside 6-adenylyltransferase [Haloplasma contractile]ERJ11975.1 Aminoglycoside 6-adenylyltransferase protein [Haloplasma contractile SSD-17B]
MRSEEEVFEQILDFAKEDDRIRAVMLNGSRLNPNAPDDIMQDYDIVYFIKDLDPSYKNNQDWINTFGDLVMMQQNDFENGYIFLMQFKDNVRIDLSFSDVSTIKEAAKEDSLTKILLDKDEVFEKGELDKPNESIHCVSKPTEQEFNEVLNEFWWIQVNIAKGIWRDELSYAKYMYDVILIGCIRKIISWKIGSENDWNVNTGKLGKWFKNYMSNSLYKKYLEIYPGNDYYEMWASLLLAGKFVRTLAIELAEDLGFTYPEEDDENTTTYVKKVRDLPKDSRVFRW